MARRGSRRERVGEHLPGGQLTWRPSAATRRAASDARTAGGIDEYLQTKTMWIDSVGTTSNPFIIRQDPVVSQPKSSPDPNAASAS